jgi:hypothetical protein
MTKWDYWQNEVGWEAVHPPQFSGGSRPIFARYNGRAYHAKAIIWRDARVGDVPKYIVAYAAQVLTADEITRAQRGIYDAPTTDASRERKPRNQLVQFASGERVVVLARRLRLQTKLVNRNGVITNEYV